MTQPVDGVDEQDHTQTEAVLAVAVSGLLAANAAGAEWDLLVGANLSMILRLYIQRSALDFASAAGLSQFDAAGQVQKTVDELLPDVESHTASWLRQAAVDRARKEALPKGQALPAGEADDAAGIIARTLATYVREVTRENIAGRLGATRRTWNTMNDLKVRPAHRAMAGQWKPLGKPFKAPGGIPIRFPGDPLAPLDLTAGCRCSLRYEMGRNL